MLDAVKRYFRSHILEEQQEESAETRLHGLQLATAALLLEVARVDDDERGSLEMEAIAHGIRQKFGLTPQETEELLALAEAESRETVSYYGFTSLINDHFNAEQKERLVELMWEVALADGSSHAEQEALVRKVADLLYIPHRVFIQAKLRAQGGS
ncbi:MAG: TerB family tellurite resistance protein [Ectothiorhodospiraceae bacterium]|nr:TerB family tellurite resistance protein [Ectothiorhodospiraceae bacterium]MCH8505085.1 TerB family tellurite resistance protein [Ectothiorhodospiraceae bacterium]